MPRRRRNESGFVLLVVLLMAAVIAISLYKEIPRVAFESQRQKELLLIERGEQYKRAIQLFMSNNKRWPTKIEDLENTNNRRYLRKRYMDPMTGKEEWRAIKIVNGVLVDSKVQNQQKKDEKQGPTSTYIGEVAGIGQSLQNQGPRTPNLALQKRGSDTVLAGAPGGSGPLGASGATGASGDPNAQPGAAGMAGMPGASGTPGLPGMPPGAPGLPPGIPGVPGQPGATGIAGATGRPGMPGATGATGASGQSSLGSGYLGSGGSSLGGGTTIGTSAGNPGAPGQGQFPPGTPVDSRNPGTGGFPPGSSPQASSAAAQMINGLLTGPRPGGPPQANAAGIAIGGSGIAGFASTADQDSIIVYNDQTNYGLWEFIYDPTKQKPLANPNGGSVGTPVDKMGSQQQQQQTQQQTSPFGPRQ